MKQFMTAAILAATTLPVHAQGPVFQTPGMPTARYPAAANTAQADAESGQTDRFTSVFNPAFSFVVDTVGDYVDLEAGDDGFDADLRIVEFSAQSWVDPNAWAYFIVASDGEEVELEEGAVHYTGLGGNTTLRAGRFFIDFGKQMQTHVHELRTLERPLVLRTYLGEEVAGDGLQLDHWFAAGDETAVRWSIGGFADLTGGHEHGADEEEEAEPEAHVEDRKDLGDFHFTARVSAFRDVGESGVFQLGASARAIPEFAFEFEPSGAEVDGLSNTVFGLDATYGWKDDTGLRSWTLGGEYLFNDGDTGAALDDAGTPADPSDDALLVIDDSVGGYYAFVDYGWSPLHSVGVQYGALELADGDETDVSELEAYYTRHLSELHRLRLSVSHFDSDVADEDSLRVALQYTAILGAHGHGVNW